nr:hypothetical protein CFP56_45180 [Quercus suber]
MWSSPGKKSKNDTTDDDGSVKPMDWGGQRLTVKMRQTLASKKVTEKGNNGKSGHNQEAEVNGGEISVQVETDMDWLSTGNMSINYLMRSPKLNRNNEELMLHDSRNVVHEVENVTHEESKVMHEERKVMHEERNMGLEESEHVKEKVSNRPKVTKVKPTWTRIAQVSEGNKKSGLIEPNTILGKWGVQLIEVDSEADSGAQMSKREKMQ